MCISRHLYICDRLTALRIRARATAPVRLGPVKRNLGALQKLIRVEPVVGGQSDADARPDDDLMPLDFERRCYGLREALRKSDRTAGLV